jgi:predicted dehydrogenase
MSSAPPARVAVLGTGAIAQVAHLPILARLRGVTVSGLYDTDYTKARALADRFEIGHVYRSTEEVWADPDVDAVIIASPSAYHEEQAREGLGAEKFVFCEKPLALSAEAGRRVLATKGADSRLMVGMNQRFRPDAIALKTFVSGGELGEVFYLRAGWLNRGVGRGRRTWRQQKAGAGGGALMDLGIQMLDLCLWMLDYPRPERITAHLHRGPGAEVEDSAVVLLDLGDQRVINTEVTWSLFSERERQYLQLLGSAGSGSVSPLRVYKDLDSGLREVTPSLAPGRENQFTASYRQELTFFAEAVRGERELPAPDDHVRLLEVIDAAYLSADRGREVVLSS